MKGVRSASVMVTVLEDAPLLYAVNTSVSSGDVMLTPDARDLLHFCTLSSTVPSVRESSVGGEFGYGYGILLYDGEKRKIVNR